MLFQGLNCIPMKIKSAVVLYLLLTIFATISMAYYIAGVLALRQEFFHANRYAREPFDFQDDGRTLKDVRKEAIAAGLSNGNVLVAVNGVSFTGYAQVHDLMQRTKPGETVEVTVRSPSGAIRQARFRVASREGPAFSVGQYIAFLAPILGVPLLGLIVGYWVQKQLFDTWKAPPPTISASRKLCRSRWR